MLPCTKGRFHEKLGVHAGMCRDTGKPRFLLGTERHFHASQSRHGRCLCFTGVWKLLEGRIDLRLSRVALRAMKNPDNYDHVVVNAIHREPGKARKDQFTRARLAARAAFTRKLS